jgi:hypothetical protein
VLLLQVRALLVDPPPPLLQSEIANVVPGDSIADVTMVTAEGDSTSLAEVIGEGCRILVFFDYRCPYCRQLAEEDLFDSTVDGIPVTWLALPSDQGRTQEFVVSHGIRQPWFRIDDWSAVGLLGVVATPTIRTFGPGPQFLADIHPDRPEVPPACRPTA